mgnify:CR=1 FL=1
MMILLYILLFLLAIAFWIVFIPFSFYINTNKHIYRFRIPGLICLQWLSHEPAITFRIWVFFIPIKVNLLKIAGKKRKTKKKKDKAGKKKKKNKKSPGKKVLFRLFRNMLRGFSLKKFDIVMDTGDFMLNARMYSYIPFINSRKNVNIQINFEDRNSLIFLLKGYVFKMLYALIVFFITKNKNRSKNHLKT